MFGGAEALAAPSRPHAQGGAAMTSGKCSSSLFVFLSPRSLQAEPELRLPEAFRPRGPSFRRLELRARGPREPSGGQRLSGPLLSRLSGSAAGRG